VNRYRFLVVGLVAGALSLAGWAAAFTWGEFAFPPGDHTYVFEIAADSLDAGSLVRIEYGYKQVGDSYDTTSVVTVTGTGVSQDGLLDGMFGGGAGAFLMFGPYLAFYGPAAFVLPFVLGDQEIAVRSEPIVAEGIATVRMDRAESYAGFECVVVTIEFDDDPDLMEIGLADGLPVPCFSRFGSEGDRTTLRLLEAR